MPGTVPEGEASAEHFAINVSTGQGFVSGLQVSRLHRSLTPQVNCGCSDVAAESRFAGLREHFQNENALKIPLWFEGSPLQGENGLAKTAKPMKSLFAAPPFRKDIRTPPVRRLRNQSADGAAMD